MRSLGTTYTRPPQFSAPRRRVTVRDRRFRQFETSPPNRCHAALTWAGAVLISFWDVVPMPVKAGTRLANVEIVERNIHQRGHPRVRMFVKNPAASAHLSERQHDAFCHLL